MIRVVGIEPLGKYPLQHRHRQERAGDLDQGKPFCVVARGRHSSGRNWAGIELRGDLASPLAVGSPVLRLIDLGKGGVSGMRQGKRALRFRDLSKSQQDQSAVELHEREVRGANTISTWCSFEPLDQPQDRFCSSLEFM